jgi:hypothetical protein
MKQQLFKLQSALLIMALAFSLNSCSYTRSTGTSSNFNKKHYNRGIVKQAINKKEKTEVLAENNPEEKLSKKEQKEALKIQVQQYVDGKNLSASNAEAPFDESSASLVEKVQGNFNEAKLNLAESKETASPKESGKIDKKIRKIEKFEAMISKVSAKMEAKMTPDPDAITPPGSGVTGLIGGIFGISGLVLAFIPIVGFLGLLLCLSAIILGAIGLKGSKRGWAITGIVLGIIGLLLFFVALLLIFSFLV